MTPTGWTPKKQTALISQILFYERRVSLTASEYLILVVQNNSHICEIENANEKSCVGNTCWHPHVHYGKRFVQKFIDVKSFFFFPSFRITGATSVLYFRRKFMMSCRDLMCDTNIAPVLQRAELEINLKLAAKPNPRLALGMFITFVIIWPSKVQ